MLIIYIDADACPVKSEVYKVARRYGMRVVIAANATMQVPADPLFELVIQVGFGVVDDWIAEQVDSGDIVITADIPLAARCIAKGSRVLGSKGRELTDNDIGSVLATRDLMTELRQGGTVTGGPAPMTPKDRSKFLAKLDDLVNAVRRANPGKS
ncbi:YaiI/YqxD family protein [soil metagenome]